MPGQRVAWIGKTLQRRIAPYQSNLRLGLLRTNRMIYDSPLRIVWFKRDLRITDHAPLLHASRGKVIPLYILEPGYWTLKDTSTRQQDMLIAALHDLDSALSRLGAPLIVSGEDMDR